MQAERTVRFSLDGNDLELDLCEQHVQQRRWLPLPRVSRASYVACVECGCHVRDVPQLIDERLMLIGPGLNRSFPCLATSELPDRDLQGGTAGNSIGYPHSQ
jgi:hypothetical protein